MKLRVQTALIILLALACGGLGLWGYKNLRDSAFANRQLAAEARQLLILKTAGTSEVGCRERGGEVSHRPFGSAFCKVAYRDAGRQCTDFKDCLGGCTLPNPGSYPQGASGLKGVCKAANVEGGCTSYLVGGRVEWEECVD